MGKYIGPFFDPKLFKYAFFSLSDVEVLKGNIQNIRTL
jgi:hypothetical protein